MRRDSTRWLIFGRVLAIRSLLSDAGIWSKMFSCLPVCPRLHCVDVSKQLVVWSMPLPSNVTQADVSVDIHRVPLVTAWSDGAAVTVVAYTSGLAMWKPLHIAGTGVNLPVESDGDVLC